MIAGTAVTGKMGWIDVKVLEQSSLVVTIVGETGEESSEPYAVGSLVVPAEDIVSKQQDFHGNITVRYSVVQCGTVRCGMVLYGTVWYSTVWYGVVRYGVVWYGVVWYGMLPRLRSALRGMRSFLQPTLLISNENMLCTYIHVRFYVCLRE